MMYINFLSILGAMLKCINDISTLLKCHSLSINIATIAWCISISYQYNAASTWEFNIVLTLQQWHDVYQCLKKLLQWQDVNQYPFNTGAMPWYINVISILKINILSTLMQCIMYQSQQNGMMYSNVIYQHCSNTMLYQYNTCINTGAMEWCTNVVSTMMQCHDLLSMS